MSCCFAAQTFCDVVTSLCVIRCDYECFQIELSKNYGVPEWREDIKNIMMKAGLKNVQITFLFVDTQVVFKVNLSEGILKIDFQPFRPLGLTVATTLKNTHTDSFGPAAFQIKSESFLEDINNILNSGDVPNLYNGDEQERIVTAMKPVVQDLGVQPTKANLMAAYVRRVRSNIHTVLCMRLCLFMKRSLLFHLHGKSRTTYFSQCILETHIVHPVNCNQCLSQNLWVARFIRFNPGTVCSIKSNLFWIVRRRGNHSEICLSPCFKSDR